MSFQWREARVGVCDNREPQAAGFSKARGSNPGENQNRTTCNPSMTQLNWAPGHPRTLTKGLGVEGGRSLGLFP